MWAEVARPLPGSRLLRLDPRCALKRGFSLEPWERHQRGMPARVLETDMNNNGWVVIAVYPQKPARNYLLRAQRTTDRPLLAFHVLRLALEGAREPEHFGVGCAADIHLNDLGFAVGQHAGLVHDHHLDMGCGLQRGGVLEQDATLGSEASPTIIAVGVARPSASAQVMTTTVMATARQCSGAHRLSSHTASVPTPLTRATRTNQNGARSANRGQLCSGGSGRSAGTDRQPELVGTGGPERLGLPVCHVSGASGGSGVRLNQAELPQKQWQAHPLDKQRKQHDAETHSQEEARSLVSGGSASANRRIG